MDFALKTYGCCGWRLQRYFESSFPRKWESRAPDAQPSWTPAFAGVTECVFNPADQPLAPGRSGRCRSDHAFLGEALDFAGGLAQQFGQHIHVVLAIAGRAAVD